MSIQYKIPEYVHVSQDCKELLSRIFVANSAKVTHTCKLRIILSGSYLVRGWFHRIASPNPCRE
jgi:hypothetical protein